MIDRSPVDCLRLARTFPHVDQVEILTGPLVKNVPEYWESLENLFKRSSKVKSCFLNWPERANYPWQHWALQFQRLRSPGSGLVCRPETSDEELHGVEIYRAPVESGGKLYAW